MRLVGRLGVAVVVLLLALRGSSACPPSFNDSPLTVVVRGGGAIPEPGDVLDWTLLVTNAGCSPGRALVWVPVEESQVFVAAGEGGTYDPALRTVNWSSASTPLLERVEPGASVVLTYATYVLPSIRYCAQAQIDGGPFVTCYDPDRGAICLSDDPASPPLREPTCIPRLSIASCSGPVGGGGSLVVRGGILEPGIAVRVGGIPAVVVSSNGGEVVATVPALPWVGEFDVELENPGQPVTVLRDAWRSLSGNAVADLYAYKEGADLLITWTGSFSDTVVTSADPAFPPICPMVADWWQGPPAILPLDRLPGITYIGIR